MSNTSIRGIAGLTIYQEMA